MSQRAKKKPNKGVVATTIVVAIILTVVLFPRRNCLLDGGTVIYRSIAFERLYQVEHRHRLYDEAGYVYYEKGYIVTLFGMEVFNNVYVDYNDGHFYGTALVSKVYTDTITKMVTHSVPLEMTRKSFTNARDVAKYDAMIEANVQNTITLELNGLAKGIFRKLAQSCSSGRKIQLMTAYNTEMGYASTDPGYIDLTNWKNDTKFLLYCEEAVIRL